MFNLHPPPLQEEIRLLLLESKNAVLWAPYPCPLWASFTCYLPHSPHAPAPAPPHCRGSPRLLPFGTRAHVIPSTPGALPSLDALLTLLISADLSVTYQSSLSLPSRLSLHLGLVSSWRIGADGIDP